MYNTGNPLGSKDILDLYDNSENIDYFVNSQQDEVPDRFGTKRLTLAGLIKRSMALRNEISDFSGALTFKPEWSDVPMNVSEGVGGEGGPLNLQAEALGNRSEINKINSREALRRSCSTAGFNLVDGSFEEGGVLKSTSDVLLHETTGNIYSWQGEYPLGTYVVEPKSSPVEVSWFNETSIDPGVGSVREGRFALRDWVSVLDFVPAGKMIDSLAFQKAIDYGASEVFIPHNAVIDLETPVQLPNRDITLYGSGRGSIIKGSGSSLIKYPLDSRGFQNIHSLRFIVGANQTGIQMHKLWNPAGKQEVQVTRCHFESNTTGSKFITVQGIWSGRIQDNEFYGTSKKNDCYGIQFITNDEMNSSVMNMDIVGNKMTLVSYPIYYSGRTTSSGGWLEGISINNNKTIASKTGVRLASTLATVINGNMIHDCDFSAIELNGDFDFVINGNVELFGAEQAILIQGIPSSILERGVISGNKINAGNGKNGIVLKTNGTKPRSISITGNMIGRVANGDRSGVGVKIDSIENVSNIVISGNAFQQLETAVDRGDQSGEIVVIGNSYLFVTNTGAGMKSTPFTKSPVITLTGGNSTEQVTVDLPVGLTNRRPDFAMMTGTGISPGQSLIGFYDFDASTATQLKFNLSRLDLGTINAGSVRMLIVANIF